MSEEKKVVLEMLNEGKINVDEAEKLLASLEETPDELQLAKPANRKFLKVLVVEENNTKVNINIPLALAEVGLKFVPKDKFKIEGKDIDVNEILTLLKEGNEGELINVETMDKGKEVKVKVFVE